MVPEFIRQKLSPAELQWLEILLAVQGPPADAELAFSASADDGLPALPFANPRTWQGMMAEAQCIVAAMAHNLGVGIPYGSSYFPFDLFIFNSRRTYRVQVKYGAVERDAGWQVTILRDRNTKPYKKGDFHMLSVVGPDGVWYLIPFAALHGQGSLRIPRRPRLRENHPGFPIERYRERWDLFR